MARLELFHLLTQPDSAAVRRAVTRLGIEGDVEFRNVAFESHRQALAERGGELTPAIWDGARLHVGRDACLALLEKRPSG